MEPVPIDPGGDAFATRLCNLLRERRRAEGASLWEIARRSDGRYSARQLRGIERGRFDPTDAAELAALYGADLSAILPARTPIAVDPDGRVETAGAIEEFTPGDPDDMLTAYLRLIRRLRNAERDPVVGLRRDDIVVLADVLDQPGEHVTDRLGALMDATRTQRRVMVGLFVAGVVVVGLAVTAVAATTNETVTSPSEGGPDGSTVATTDVVGDDGPDDVDPGPDATTTPADVPAADTGAPRSEADAGGRDDAPDAEGATSPPETVFVDEPWSAPVGTPVGLDVSPLPAPEPEPEPAPPPAAPDPAPEPAPAPEPDPTVAVGAPPVPEEPAPVVDPPAPESPPEPPESSDVGVGVDDDGDTVAVGSPPVPEGDDPLPTP